MSDLPFEEKIYHNQQITSAMGEALAAWQGIEHGLFVLAHCYLNGDPTASSIAFFHIKSGENKIALVDKFCRVGMSQDLYQFLWKPLLKALNAASVRRNALAHGELQWIDNPKAVNVTTVYRVVLSSHFLDAYSSRSGSAPCLTVESIQADTCEFRSLAVRIFRFVFAVIDDWPQRTARFQPKLREYLQAMHRAEQGTAPQQSYQSESDEGDAC